MADAEPEFEDVVGERDAGLRLDQFLAAPLGSRARAARAIAAGLVEVDGRPVRKRHALVAGECVVVARALPDPAQDRVSGGSQLAPGARPQARWPAGAAESVGVAAPVPYRIAYEDEHLIVVDKAAGVVVHPGRGHSSGTLAQLLADRAAGGEPGRAGVVHRLDRDTSGLLVLAKSERAHRELKALIEAHAVRREYLALVDGRPEARTGTIDAPIGRDRRDRLLQSLDSDSPRAARTHFEALEWFSQATLLRVTLETGRTHQIRVHLRAIGHPVTGDHAYGGAARFGLERQFLHAARLTFAHPCGGAQVDVSSPLPDDLAGTLALARAAQ